MWERMKGWAGVRQVQGDEDMVRLETKRRDCTR